MKDDVISRQAAISLPVKPKEDRYFQTQNLDDAYNYGWYSLQKCIEKLPSAQPENIRCYECKHGIHSGCGDVYTCHVSPELVMEHAGDFYCGYAERKTDEEVN